MKLGSDLCAHLSFKKLSSVLVLSLGCGRIRGFLPLAFSHLIRVEQNFPCFNNCFPNGTSSSLLPLTCAAIRSYFVFMYINCLFDLTWLWLNSRFSAFGNGIEWEHYAKVCRSLRLQAQMREWSCSIFPIIRDFILIKCSCICSWGWDKKKTTLGEIDVKSAM